MSRAGGAGIFEGLEVVEVRSRPSGPLSSGVKAILEEISSMRARHLRDGWVRAPGRADPFRAASDSIRSLRRRARPTRFAPASRASRRCV